MQKELERIQFKLRIPQRKPWGTMAEDVADAARRASNEATVLRGVLPADVPKAKQLVEEVQAELGRLAAAVSLKDPDRTSIRVANALERVAALELLQAPGLPYRLPAQYASLPRLTGRATVEMVVERSDGRAVFIADGSEDGPQKQAVLEVTLDGYSAPITAGNFVKNVMAGLYNGKELKVNEVSVLAGEDKQGALPLEAMIAGDFEPVYRTPLDVRGGELPVLPLSIYGSVAMQNLPPGSQAPGVVSDQEFFIYKFVRQQSGLAGLSFDEGQFGVFGYVTKGADLLPRIEDGDRLVRVRVVSGADKLVIPAEQQKVE